jgi:hypothetical protein
MYYCAYIRRCLGLTVEFIGDAVRDGMKGAGRGHGHDQL